MQLLLKTEESEDVINSMFVVISIYDLKSDNPSVRIKAIESLKGNLEPIVKVQLKKLIDNDLDEGVRLKAQQALTLIESRTKIFKIDLNQISNFYFIIFIENVVTDDNCNYLFTFCGL